MDHIINFLNTIWNPWSATSNKKSVWLHRNSIHLWFSAPGFHPDCQLAIQKFYYKKNTLKIRQEITGKI